ncbi:MAG TPA: DUF4293 domain-containing protein [Bacteroidales bacterium]|nr:DUF4293 domain-containing protein [Bacteroidales bacterium]HRZ77880.1 DUF4293 domain-containing protein [Bacteroidales bacterium]
MIQRIQSIYLLLAAAALALMYFFPLSEHSFRGLVVPFTLLSKGGAQELTASMMITVWPLVVGVLVLMILSLAALFLYSKRSTQMKVVMVSVLLNILLILGSFWMVRRLASRLDPAAVDQVMNYQFGAYLPVLSLLFLILAHRGIKKDEQKVRAADRLR